MLTINIISTETCVKASWFHGMRTSDVLEVLKISRAIVCDQQKLFPAVCLYPYKPCDHLCVPLSRAETENCYQLLPKRFGNKI